MNSYIRLKVSVMAILSTVFPHPAYSVQPVDFYRISSAADACTAAYNLIPCPSLEGTQQTASLILDITGDGKKEFVITERTATPSVVWFQRTNAGWVRHIIDNTLLRIEAGGDFYDIDGDGDLDISFGGDSLSNEIWWWENPAPNFKSTWTRHLIKNDGATKHHDQIFGDFDHDGNTELVFWNQKGKKLFMAEIPENPKSGEPWPKTVIFRAPETRYQGLAKADIDGDGQVDIVGAGYWFKHQTNGTFTAHIIDPVMAYTRSAAGQIIEGGWAETVFVCGDCNGPLKMYQYRKGSWHGKTLIPSVTRGHSLQLTDFNGDGHLDIFVAEMRLNSKNPSARIRILYGDGKGKFKLQEISQGMGNHESKVADLDGDGDIDILSKPYNWNTPRIDIWLNQGIVNHSKLRLDRWRKHLVGTLSQNGTRIVHGDFDRDGYTDIAAADSWFKNPGKLSATWSKNKIGGTLRNVALAEDFNHDKQVDLLGAAGGDSTSGHTLVWAENSPTGFNIHTNIKTGGEGDFLQGIGFLKKAGHIALTWHNMNGGVQAVIMPKDPVNQPWPVTTLSSKSQAMDLSVGDIDLDGHEDILLGNQYLRYQKGKFERIPIGTFSDLEPKASPGRNALADINGDGKLDAIIAFEDGRHLIWYAQLKPKQWQRHIITSELNGQGFSMDVADFDLDGDPDIVVGEHRGKPDNRVIIFENKEKGLTWNPWVVDTGPAHEIDHHNRIQAVDIDRDGDLDIISLGWKNKKIWLYENTVDRSKNIK